MLEWAYNLGSFDLFDGEIQSDSLDDIYQMLAKILAKRVLDRGRKGLYREYQGRGERLPLTLPPKTRPFEMLVSRKSGKGFRDEKKALFGRENHSDSA